MNFLFDLKSKSQLARLSLPVLMLASLNHCGASNPEGVREDGKCNTNSALDWSGLAWAQKSLSYQTTASDGCAKAESYRAKAKAFLDRYGESLRCEARDMSTRQPFEINSVSVRRNHDAIVKIIEASCLPASSPSSATPPKKPSSDES